MRTPSICPTYTIHLIITFVATGIVGGFGCAAGTKNQSVNETTLLVYNAKIWTGLSNAPVPEAFVVRDGYFTFVGSKAEARMKAGSFARSIDAHGRRIIPGIIDAHMHLLGGGIQLDRLDLRHAKNRDEFIRLIADRAKNNDDDWVLGGRWSTESWPDAAQPDKSWTDNTTNEKPVLLYRMDGHAALVNTVALKLASIGVDGPPDPPGGRIERDPITREPTGILKDSAIELVAQFIPNESKAELDEALRRAMRHANANGITCVHTMEDWAAYNVFDRARRRGELTLRIRQYLSEPDWEGMLPRVQAEKKDNWLRIAGFKEYADGSLGSRTAHMVAPYSDNSPENSKWCGLRREAMLAPQALEKKCKAVWAANFTPAIHAIGDSANHEVLNIYSRVENKLRYRRGVAAAGRHVAPCRLEHAQHLLPKDIARIAEIGVTASMQPLHKADDARYCEKAIGTERCTTSYAYRSLLDAGVLVAFGSDWPVVSLNPFMGMHAAVTAKSVDGDVFVPQQRITVEEAMTAYTSSAARAAGEEKLGLIAEGWPADFVILDREILAVAPDQIDDINVVSTYVAGVERWNAVTENDAVKNEQRDSRERQ